MIENNQRIKVTNRYSGTVGYTIPDLDNLHRNYQAGETKEVTFEELYKLANVPGGEYILKNYLVVKDYEALKEILPSVEPEYFYTKEDVKNLMETGSLDAFLDCLDFAPDGIIDIIKELAVDLPLNDISKRNAIREKTGFNVDAAIRVKNTKYDGDPNGNFEKAVKAGRRVAAPTVKGESEVAPAAETGRRTAPKYKIASTTK